MKSYIIEYKKCINQMLCNDIIDLLYDYKNEKKEQENNVINLTKFNIVDEQSESLSPIITSIEKVVLNGKICESDEVEEQDEVINIYSATQSLLLEKPIGEYNRLRKGFGNNKLVGTIQTNLFIIPKDSNKWTNIEMLLYKELLNKINDYKNSLLCLNTADPFKKQLIKSLNEPMYLKNFVIQKIGNIIMNELKSNIVSCKTFIKDCLYRENNRYNILTFIFFLNTVEEGGEFLFDDKNFIKAERGKLVILPDDMNYRFNCIPPLSNEQYIITGQIIKEIN